MNLREKYLEFHEENKHMWKDAAGDTALTQAIQFADDFMAQCDKLEKKVNDLARVLRDTIDENADRIKDHEKEISKLKDQYRWRDVNEELPEIRVEVLVVLKSGYQTIGWRDSEDDDNSWWEVFGPDYYEVDKWMPMPEFNQKGGSDE